MTRTTDHSCVQPVAPYDLSSHHKPRTDRRETEIEKRETEREETEKEIER